MCALKVSVLEASTLEVSPIPYRCPFQMITFFFFNWVDNVNWPPQRDSEADVRALVLRRSSAIRSYEGLTLERHLQNLFTVAN